MCLLAGVDNGYKVPFLLDMYMKLTLLCLKLICGSIFQNFITFIIIVASVMVGVQTYPALENNKYLNIADSVLMPSPQAAVAFNRYHNYPVAPPPNCLPTSNCA